MIRLPFTSTPGRLIALAALALAWSAGPARAQDPQDLPPAHLSYIEGRVVLDREGGTEDAEMSTPLAPGDRVRTEDGRAEILFGDGSLAQLDSGTTLDLLSDTRLRLLEGRLAIVATGSQADRLQVDTPEGAVAIQTAGEYRLRLFDADGRGTLELSVVRGAAELMTDQDRVSVGTGERSWARTGEAPAYPVRFNAASFDEFDRWALDRASDRRGGATSARYVPAPLRSYAGVLDTYGSWSYEPTYGHVWYPRVEIGWRPYYEGRWRYYGRHGWTWVGGGRWGWPTHHYGRWGVSNAGAWFWIPGAHWGPAWVSWAIASDYVSWCPIGFDNRPVIGWGYGPYRPGGYGRDPWHAWTVVPRNHFGGYRVVSGIAVDGRRLGDGRGPRPSFVVQDRAPTPPRGHAVADRGAYGLGVAVPRGGAGSTTVGRPGDGRSGLDPARGDRRALAGSVPTGPPTTSGPASGSRRLRPSSGAPPYGSPGSRTTTRPIERTPEDLARGSRSAIPRGSRSADRLPGDVGARPMPAPSAPAAVTTPPAAGWRADQVPVYRGGRREQSGRPDGPGASIPESPSPGAWRSYGGAPRTRGGDAANDVGGRARGERSRAGDARGDGIGPSHAPAPSSAPAPRQAPSSPGRMAPPPPPPSASPHAAPPPSASPRQAPSGARGGSAVPRGGPPPSRRP